MVKEFINQFKWYFAGGAAVILILSVFWLMNSRDIEVIESAEIEDTVPETEDAETESVEAESSTFFVEVKGAVKSPGVYELAKDARVINVLDMAGLLSVSDLKSVNQSQKISDEMVIYVPYEGEEVEADFSSEDEKSEETDTVNINTADINGLTTLNGIGEKKAALIIEYREANGLFMKKEDLMNISGIGEKTFESLEPYITIE